MTFTNSVITGWGSEMPQKYVPNAAFLEYSFWDSNGQPFAKSNQEIIDKLEEISGIQERRYIGEDSDSAYLGARAASKAISCAGLQPDDIDGIIVAHNFGNVKPGDHQGHLIPNLAALIKGKLGIVRPKCYAYDVLFGCPGWLEGMIQGHSFIQMGRSKNILIIGVEVISRVLNPNDLNSMLFGDGAGAVVLSRSEDEKPRGILAHNTYSHCGEELDYLKMTELSANPAHLLAPKMDGKNVFKYALIQMPELISECLKDAKTDIKEIKKYLFHQANEKMIMAIAKSLMKKHDLEVHIPDLVPFMVQKTGNSSVATIPTLLDHLLNGHLEGHKLSEGDLTVMSSVGAGMHCNCLLYKF